MSLALCSEKEWQERIILKHNHKTQSSQKRFKEILFQTKEEGELWRRRKVRKRKEEGKKSTFFFDLHKFFSSKCFLTLHTKSKNDSLLLDEPLNLRSVDLVSLVRSSLLYSWCRLLSHRRRSVASFPPVFPRLDFRRAPACSAAVPVVDSGSLFWSVIFVRDRVLGANCSTRRSCNRGTRTRHLFHAAGVLVTLASKITPEFISKTSNGLLSKNSVGQTPMEDVALFLEVDVA